MRIDIDTFDMEYGLRKMCGHCINNPCAVCAALYVLEEQREAVQYLLAFVPPWAKDVPDGLDPTFYGTGSADGDRAVKARVDEIRSKIPAPQTVEGRVGDSPK